MASEEPAPSGDLHSIVRRSSEAGSPRYRGSPDGRTGPGLLAGRRWSLSDNSRPGICRPGRTSIRGFPRSAWATGSSHARELWPGQDRLERRLRGIGIPRHEPLQELAVGQANRAAGIEELAELPLDVICGCAHTDPSRRSIGATVLGRFSYNCPHSVGSMQVFSKNRDGAGRSRSFIVVCADEVPGSRQPDGQRTTRHCVAADSSSLRRGDPHRVDGCSAPGAVRRRAR